MTPDRLKGPFTEDDLDVDIDDRNLDLDERPNYHPDLRVLPQGQRRALRDQMLGRPVHVNTSKTSALLVGCLGGFPPLNPLD